MQSQAEDVATYVQQAPADRKQVLTQLRKLCVDTLKGYEENMEYGMPSYKKDGAVAVAWASQKNYIALYIDPKIVKANQALLKGLDCGKSCIRYTRPDKMNFAVVKKLLVGTRQAQGSLG